MVGIKLLKSEFNQDEYIKLANWCNNHEYKTIEDKGEYYEVVDCTPTQEELNEIEKSKLLQQLELVNTQIQEVAAATMCDNGNGTFDVIISSELVTMTTDKLNEYRTKVMTKRVNLLQQIKELK